MIVMPDETSSTIACVSGFLFNMPDQTVRLVTPCNANQRWPCGYWVVDQGRFETREELESLLERMGATHIAVRLTVDSPVRMRRDLRCTWDGERLTFSSRYLATSFFNYPGLERLGELVARGGHTAAEIASLLEPEGLDLTGTFDLLLEMHRKGLLDEEPDPQVVREILPVR